MKKQEEKISSKENSPDKQNKHLVKVNIRCRKCFMVEGYLPDENTCKHCGSIIYRIDIY
jgi:rRNA maturation endonuclease Nob1